MIVSTPAKLSADDWNSIYLALSTYKSLPTVKRSILNAIGVEGKNAVGQGVNLSQPQWRTIYYAVQAELDKLAVELRDPDYYPEGDAQRFHQYAACLHTILGELGPAGTWAARVGYVTGSVRGRPDSAARKGKKQRARKNQNRHRLKAQPVGSLQACPKGL